MAHGGLPGLAALRAQGQAGDLSLPVGRPVADGPVRLQAASGRHGAAIELPDSVRHGPAAHRHDRGPEELPGRAVDLQVCPAWPVRRVAQRVAAAHGERSPTTSCIIHSMHTEAINHDPAITFFQTGAQLAGRPSMGSWLAYGLGSENHDLPAFVVMISQGAATPTSRSTIACGAAASCPRAIRASSSAAARSGALSVQPRRRRRSRRAARCSTTSPRSIDLHHEETGDPEILTRIAQYELAFRMQTSVPELTDLSRRAQAGPRPVWPRRAEARHLRGQLPAGPPAGRARRALHPALSHAAGTSTATCPARSRSQCRDTDQPSAALIKDLKQRGLLDDTLVIWGGEFGRTVYWQGTSRATNYGRDHHPRCFTVWLAGGGIKPGMTLGETDDFCYNIVKDPVHVHDLHATMLALPGDRPHAADLQVPGPRLPADRRAWEGGEGDFGLIPRCHWNAKRLIFAATGRVRQFVDFNGHTSCHSRARLVTFTCVTFLARSPF